jgi:uncharacterized protein
MNFVVVLTCLVCVFIAVYLGKRLQFWLDLNLSGFFLIVYWLGIFALGIAFLLSKLLINFTSYFSLLVALIVCLVYTSLIFDTIYLLSKKKFKPELMLSCVYLGCTAVIFIFGNQMATNSKIVHYQVKINKQANVDHLRIVQLSDIHINEMTRHKFIQQMVNKVNELNADFIVITGDTIDKKLSPFVKDEFNQQMKELKSKYGTYVIFGNHEYLETKGEKDKEQNLITAFKQANMNVLKDDIIYLNDLGITLIGRDDFSSSSYEVTRASLSDLMLFSDTSSPIILLDHQPKDLAEPANLGVDLMISGHTHGGQIFPVNFLADLMYKNAYGMYQDIQHHFTSIVSNGYGFGSLPIRFMTRSEIVVIDASFDKKVDKLKYETK